MNLQLVSTVSSGFTIDGWQDDERRHQQRVLRVILGFNLDGCHSQEAVQIAIQVGWQDEEERHQECFLMVSFGFTLDGCHNQEAVQSVFLR
jgi:Fe-S-cluster formation regulator IscX/YfhJ